MQKSFQDHSPGTPKTMKGFNVEDGSRALRANGGPGSSVVGEMPP